MAKNLNEPLMTVQEFERYIDDIVRDFVGNSAHLRQAIGDYYTGRLMGWHYLRLVLSRDTYIRDQKILGFDFKDQLPARGKYASKSFGLKITDNLNNFWEVVKSHVRISPSDKHEFLDMNNLD